MRKTSKLAILALLFCLLGTLPSFSTGFPYAIHAVVFFVLAIVTIAVWDTLTSTREKHV